MSADKEDTVFEIWYRVKETEREKYTIESNMRGIASYRRRFLKFNLPYNLTWKFLQTGINLGTESCKKWEVCTGSKRW